MKLGRFAILMFGIMVAVIALSWGFFYKYTPDEKEVGFLQENTKANNDEKDKMPAANKRVAKAKALVDKAGQDWQATVATRTPGMTAKTGGIDLSVNAWDLSVAYPKYRDQVQQAVNAQVKKGGVTIVNGPMIPLQTDVPANEILTAVFNYPVLPFPVVIYDLGTITVQGTYKQIMTNVRAYKDMPHYLAVADGLRLDGTSPLLTGTYNLSIVGFIRTKSIAPPVAEQAAAAAAQSMMGGPGSPMGGPGGLGMPPTPGAAGSAGGKRGGGRNFGPGSARSGGAGA